MYNVMVLPIHSRKVLGLGLLGLGPVNGNNSFINLFASVTFATADRNHIYCGSLIGSRRLYNVLDQTASFPLTFSDF